jgi:hypothetical protein
LHEKIVEFIVEHADITEKSAPAGDEDRHEQSEKE